MNRQHTAYLLLKTDNGIKHVLPQNTLNKLGLVAHTFNPRTWEAEANRSLGVCGQLDLHTEFQISQGYTVRPVSKNKNSVFLTYNHKGSFNGMNIWLSKVIECLKEKHHSYYSFDLDESLIHDRKVSFKN